MSKPTAPTSRLSILHIVTPAPAGGLERVVNALAIGHHRRGHDVRVAAVFARGERDDAFFLAPLQEATVSVDVLRIPPRGYLEERRRIRDICKSIRPDIVHTHGYRPDVLHVGTARRLGIAAVTTEHGASKVGGRTHLYEWLQLASLRRFDAVVAVSDRIARYLRDKWVPSERIHLIPNAWDGHVPALTRIEARQRLGLPANAFVVGWVGRFIPAKGLDVFLAGIALLCDPGLCVSIVGDGPERASLTDMSGTLGLGPQVTFHGLVDDARDLLPAFDVYVLSSRTEGTPVVLLEAMAAGVPIVAAGVGGVPDVVRHGREALVIQPDDPQALAGAIRDVQANPEAAWERARAARHRLDQEYAIEPWLRRYEDVYRLVLHSPCGR